MANTLPIAHDTELLRSSLKEIDEASQTGLSEIASIARMARLWLESPPSSVVHFEVIRDALSTIWTRAQELESHINLEAEALGCAHTCTRLFNELPKNTAKSVKQQIQGVSA